MATQKKIGQINVEGFIINQIVIIIITRPRILASVSVFGIAAFPSEAFIDWMSLFVQLTIQYSYIDWEITFDWASGQL